MGTISTIEVWVKGDRQIINQRDYDPKIHSLTPPKKHK